jgi:hypothetical protein
LALGSEQCLPSTVHVDDLTTIVGQVVPRAHEMAQMAEAAGPVALDRVVADRIRHRADGAATLATAQAVEAILAVPVETRRAVTGDPGGRRARAHVMGVREGHVLMAPARVHREQRVAGTVVRAMLDDQTVHHAVTVTTGATTCAMAGCAVAGQVGDGRTLPVEPVVETRRRRVGRVAMTVDAMMTVATDAVTMGEVVAIGARMTGGLGTPDVTAVAVWVIAAPTVVLRTGVVILADGEMLGVAVTGEAIAAVDHFVRSREPKPNAVQRRCARVVEEFVNPAQRFLRASWIGGKT